MINNYLKRQNIGFTLLELVFVIVILAVLTVAAIPEFSSYSTAKLIGAVNKLAAHIRYAQQLAISKQVRCGLFFDTDSRMYYVYENPNNKVKAIDPYTQRELEIYFENAPSFKELIFDSLDFGNVLEFDQWGRPYTATDSRSTVNTRRLLVREPAKITLRSESDNSLSKTIQISPNTGNVNIE